MRLPLERRIRQRFGRNSLPHRPTQRRNAEPLGENGSGAAVDVVVPDDAGRTDIVGRVIGRHASEIVMKRPKAGQCIRLLKRHKTEQCHENKPNTQIEQDRPDDAMERDLSGRKNRARHYNAYR